MTSSPTDSKQLRVEYIETVLQPVLEKKPVEYIESVSRRIMQVCIDVFGMNSDSFNFLEDVRRRGTFDVRTDFRMLSETHTDIIKAEYSGYLVEKLAYQLCNLSNGNLQLFEEESVYPLWEILEQSGMSDERIAKYFECFLSEQSYQA